MIDDFEAILPPADEDPGTEDRFRPPARTSARDPQDDDDWRFEFRSYLDDPA